jgi:ribonuclease HI
VKYMVQLEFKATNNMAEYEALIFGLSAALSLGDPPVPCEGGLPADYQAGPRRM